MDSVKTPAAKPPMGRVVAASVVGSVLEWYDFALFGIAAGLIFSKQFFPDISPEAGLLASFATFGVGFLVRPVGGAIFGSLGDKIGRKKVLVLTLILMGASTFAIGLLPTYGQVGLLAPILLVFLRVLQGLGAGAELGGAFLLTAENAPNNKRGFYASLPNAGTMIGGLLATGTFLLVSMMPSEMFNGWGWRLPFLLSVVVILVALWIRARLPETHAFEELKKEKAEAHMPVLEVVKEHPKAIARTMAFMASPFVSNYLAGVFVLGYVTTQLGLDRNVALTAVTISYFCSLITIPLFGALSDRLGRRPVIISGAIGLVAFAYPFFWLLNTKDPLWISVAIIVMACLVSQSGGGPQGAFLTELFPTRVRYTGVALGRELSAALIGGTTPLAATALIAATGGDPWLVGIAVMAVGIISAVTVFLAPETRGIALSDVESPRALRSKEKDMSEVVSES